MAIINPTLIVEYAPFVEDRPSGIPPRLNFLRNHLPGRGPDVLPQECRQDSVMITDYFKQYGFTSREDIINFPEYVIANLTGHSVTTFHPGWSEGYRWTETVGPDHPRWLHIQPFVHGFTNRFLIMMNWEDDYSRYEGIGDDPYISFYLYERDMTPFTEEDISWVGNDDESKEAYKWYRRGYPKDVILKKYGVPTDADMQTLANASGLPILLARWNKNREKGQFQRFPFTEGILQPE